jgi:hypothetical protein
VAVVRRAPAHVGQHEDPLVAGLVPGASMEAVDPVGRLAALELELRDARQVDAGGRLGVHAVEVRVEAEALPRRHEREVAVGAAGDHQVEGEVAGRKPHVEPRPHRLGEDLGARARGQRREELEGVDRGPLVPIALARRGPA